MATEIFTDEEHEMNRTEGWDLFDYWTHSGESYWCIQRMEDPEFNSPFWSDTEAYHWVKEQAKVNLRHRRAIEAHGDLVK